MPYRPIIKKIFCPKKFIIRIFHNKINRGQHCKGWRKPPLYVMLVQSLPVWPRRRSHRRDAAYGVFIRMLWRLHCESGWSVSCCQVLSKPQIHPIYLWKQWSSFYVIDCRILLFSSSHGSVYIMHGLLTFGIQSQKNGQGSKAEIMRRTNYSNWSVFVAEQI